MVKIKSPIYNDDTNAVVIDDIFVYMSDRTFYGIDGICIIGEFVNIAGFYYNRDLNDNSSINDKTHQKGKSSSYLTSAFSRFRGSKKSNSPDIDNEFENEILSRYFRAL